LLKSAHRIGFDFMSRLDNAVTISVATHQETKRMTALDDKVVFIGQRKSEDVVEQALYAVLKAFSGASSQMSNQDYLLFQYLVHNFSQTGGLVLDWDADWEDAAIELDIGLDSVRCSSDPRCGLIMVKRGVKALRERKFILTDVDRAVDIEELKTILANWREINSTAEERVISSLDDYNKDCLTILEERAREQRLEDWMKVICSDFMDEAPGIEGGPRRVRECFRAISDGIASDEDFQLTKMIHESYTAFCRQSVERPA
jgi:hypothetical protein